MQAQVTLYDLADATNPVLLGQADAACDFTGVIPVLDGDGDWMVDLYSMSPSDGIQAFQVAIAPEPSSVALAVIGASGAFLWPRRATGK